MGVKWTAITRHRAGTTFVLAFFLVFALLNGILLAEAVRVYHGIDGRADDTHTRSVPLTYLAGAARRADTEGGLGIAVLEDGAHALRAYENGKAWLYLCRGGYLYKQIEGKPEDTAERLCAAGSLRLRWVGRLIRADYTAPDGGRATLLLKPRAGGGAR